MGVPSKSNVSLNILVIYLSYEKCMRSLSFTNITKVGGCVDAESCSKSLKAFPYLMEAEP